MHNVGRVSLGAVALGALLLTAQGAQANTLLPRLTGKTQLGVNHFRYFYSVDLTGTATGSNIKAGSFFTMYDFLGYISGSAAVGAGYTSDWSATEQFTGFDGPAQSPPDSATALNVTFHYSGAQQNADVVDVLKFSLDSIYGTTSVNRNTWYSAKDFDDQGDDQGNSGQVRGAAIPELGMMPIFGGMLGLGALALRRRNKKA
jgi:hypothetical protein